MKINGKPVTTVDATSSQGVQVGSGNNQTNNNYYGAVEYSFLSTLRPHKAIARLREMPRDDAVSMLASVPPEEVAEVLAVMLKADEALAIALLADINQRKAKELIESFQERAAWLDCLPTASEEIARRAAELGWDRGRATGDLERLTGNPHYTGAFIRRYGDELIWWGDYAWITVGGAMAKAYDAIGGPHGGLGMPQSGECPVTIGGRRGSMQTFEDGNTYTSEAGSYAVLQPVLDKYETFIWDDNLLGFPIANAEDLSSYRRQRFSQGAIYSSTRGVFAVLPETGKTANREGDEWFPVSDESLTNPSGASGVAGWVQRFENSAGAQLAVYSSDQHGVHRVMNPVLPYYEGLGGPASWLGLPLREARPARDYSGRWIQQFEGGGIHEGPRESPVAVSTATANFTVGRLGWVVSEEMIVGGEGSMERIQYFEKGAVVLRDGRQRILIWQL